MICIAGYIISSWSKVFIPVCRNAFKTWHQDKTIQHHDQRDSVNHVGQRLPTLLDYAKLVNNGKFLDHIVDDVKSFRNAIIILTLILPYRLIYNQSVIQVFYIISFIYFSFLQFNKRTW